MHSLSRTNSTVYETFCVVHASHSRIFLVRHKLANDTTFPGRFTLRGRSVSVVAPAAPFNQTSRRPVLHSRRAIFPQQQDVRPQRNVRCHITHNYCTCFHLHSGHPLDTLAHHLHRGCVLTMLSLDRTRWVSTLSCNVVLGGGPLYMIRTYTTQKYRTPGRYSHSYYS
jgi:hypothetical protein